MTNRHRNCASGKNVNDLILITLLFMTWEDDIACPLCNIQARIHAWIVWIRNRMWQVGFRFCKVPEPFLHIQSWILIMLIRCSSIQNLSGKVINWKSKQAACTDERVFHMYSVRFGLPYFYSLIVKNLCYLYFMSSWDRMCTLVSLMG